MRQFGESYFTKPTLSFASREFRQNAPFRVSTGREPSRNPLLIAKCASIIYYIAIITHFFCRVKDYYVNITFFYKICKYINATISLIPICDRMRNIYKNNIKTYGLIHRTLVLFFIIINLTLAYDNKFYDKIPCSELSLLQGIS